jgi:hypothetical protein
MSTELNEVLSIMCESADDGGALARAMTLVFAIAVSQGFVVMKSPPALVEKRKRAQTCDQTDRGPKAMDGDRIWCMLVCYGAVHAAHGVRTHSCTRCRLPCGYTMYPSGYSCANPSCDEVIPTGEGVHQSYANP